MDDEYVKIMDIVKDDNKNDVVNDNLIKVYQLQPYKNSALIMHVGNMINVFDQNIHTIDIENLKCHIVGKIYDNDKLEKHLDNKIIPIITVLICKDNNNYPSAYLSYNFNVKNVENNYLSTKDNKIFIDGNYSISLHLINKKYVVLECMDDYVGQDDMMEQLTKYLLDEEILKMF